jgi:hydrogenase maturation protease
MKTLIIGLGNTLHGDDGIGVLAVEYLETLGFPPEIEMLTCQELTPDMAEELAFCARVAFITSISPGCKASGSIAMVEIQPSQVDPLAPILKFDIDDLLAIAQMLYGHHPFTVKFSVSAEQFDRPGSLSGPVEKAFPKLIKQIKKWAMLVPVNSQANHKAN